VDFGEIRGIFATKAKKKYLIFNALLSMFNSSKNDEMCDANEAK